MIAPALWLLMAGASVEDPAVPVLRAVRERTARDTIHLELVFAGARPGSARIGIGGDPHRTGDFLLEFDGAQADRAALRSMPSWLHDRTRKDSDKIRLTADLDERTPWRGRWDGNTLHLVLLDRVDRPSLLTNPWVLGAASALVLGGTAIAWTSLDETPNSDPLAPPTTEEDIPPPDIAFP
jgi:hypothetical protein